MKLYYFFILGSLFIPFKASSQAGAIDTSFADNGLFLFEAPGFHTTNATDIESLDDGSYVICGKVANRVPNVSNFLAMKLKHDGTFDETFGTGGYSYHGLYFRAFTHALGIDKQGNILLTGQDFNDVTGLEDIGNMRLTPDGSVDLSFGDSGRVSLDYGSHEEGHAIIQQPDGKILITGHSNYDAPTGTIGTKMNNFFVARLSPAGMPDPNFGYDGFFTLDVNGNSSDYSKDMILKSDGKILCSGTSSNGSSRYCTLIQLNTDGTLDPTFGAGGVMQQLIGTDGILWHITMQSDGKIIGVGQAIFAGSDYNLIIARYNFDGSIDSSFSNDGWASFDLGGFDEKFESAVCQSDGKIVVAGYTYNGIIGNPVVFRFNSDGTLDSEFASNGIFILTSNIEFDETKSCTISSDGRIVVTGIMHDFLGSGSKAFAFRLLSGCDVVYTLSASGPTTVCKGEKVTLVVNPSATSYQWTQNGSNINGATNSTYFAKTTGVYACKVTGECGTAFTNSIQVTVNPKPNASIQPTGIVNICQGDSLKLKSNSTPGVSYQWFYNGAAIAGATSNVYWAKDAGKYFVQTTKLNCTRQSTKTTIKFNCKISETTDGKFLVFPNPSSGKISVVFNSADEEASWILFDLTGQKRAEGNMHFDSNESQLDFSSLSPGNYFLCIESGLKIYRYPISILKE